MTTPYVFFREGCCQHTGRGEVDTKTISTVFRYVQEFGLETVMDWVERAVVKTGGWSDSKMGQYISGIRRSVLKEQEGEE